MSRRAVVPALLLSLASLPLQAQVPAAVDSSFSDVADPGGPGCVAALDSAGTRRWIATYGLRDLERGGANDSLTVFEAGSVSKQVTAAALVLLARAGRLSLDDDIRRWLPELPRLGRTTVRQLLHHQSGWREWRDLAEVTRWPSDAATYTLQDVLGMLSRQRRLNFAPGTEYLYSNSNYALAVLIAERASGESFRAWTTREIFAPLGMTHTLWRDTLGEIVPNRALAWTPGDSGTYRLDMPNETVIGPGGLLTTVPDLMRWLGNLDSERVGGPGFRAQMEDVGVLASGRPTEYAMGLEVKTVGGERMVSHAGWTGGYVAFAGRLPGRALALGILCNTSALNTDDLGPELLARLAGLPAPAAPAPTRDLGVPATSGVRSRLAGTYRSLRTRQLVTLAGFTGGFTINRSIRFTTTDGGDYISADGSRIAHLQLSAGGNPSGLALISTTGDTVRYERLAEPVSDSLALRAFAGRYRNAETGATIEIRRAGDHLVAWRGGVLHDDLVPRFRDGFRAPSTSWVLTFGRDATGRVSSFELDLPRTRRLEFRRMP